MPSRMSNRETGRGDRENSQYITKCIDCIGSVVSNNQKEIMIEE